MQSVKLDTHQHVSVFARPSFGMQAIEAGWLTLNIVLFLLQVNQVLQRMAGHNPVGIICTEAQAKHGASPAWPVMQRVLSGADAGSDCVRRQLPVKGVVVGGADTVAKVLLELATDDRILSRCYEGWRPYL